MQYSTHFLRHVRFTIGQNIRAARDKQKMTLRHLSRKSGVPEFKIDQFELGKNNISVEEMVRLGCVLGVRAEEIFNLRFNEIDKNREVDNRSR